MVVNEIHGKVLMRMLSVMYNTHTSRIIIDYHHEVDIRAGSSSPLYSWDC